MDEMDEYRERIERRHEERRMKNDRRRPTPPPPAISTDWFFWIDMVFFALMAVGYYIASKN